MWDFSQMLARKYVAAFISTHLMQYLPEATLMRAIVPFVAFPHKWHALFRATAWLP
jgi:hypothetical protein